MNDVRRSATSPNSQDPRVVRTRRDIAETVRALIVEQGWGSVTHQRVAELAGYARNTVYRHFPERPDLLHHAGTFADEMVHITPTGDTRSDLIGEMKAFRDLLFDTPVGVFLSTIIERAERDPEVEIMRKAIVSSGEQITRQTIDNALAKNDIKTDRSTDDLTAQLAGPIVYARLCQNRAVSDNAIERLVDNLLQTT